MTPCVVEALVAAFFDESGRGPAAAAVVRGRPLAAPQLLPFEILHVARSVERHGRLRTDAAAAGLMGALAAPIELFPIDDLVGRIWELWANLSSYDASYVALAEWLGFPLATLDERIARSPGPLCDFIVPA